MSERKEGANRRVVIQASIGLAAACAPAASVRAQQQPSAPSCGVSSQTEAGPFYPVAPIPQRWSLVGEQRASGQLLYILGAVTGRDCAPAADTAVVVWQADANGCYNHPRAENTQPLDANFLYFGQWRTRPDGLFLTKTVLPAPYRFRGLRRAPHIHFAFTHAERGSLTTELYFSRPEDVRRRSEDRVWDMRDRETRDAMIVDLHPAATWPIAEHPIEADALWCRYELTLA